MILFRIVRVDKVNNPSGRIGIRRRLVCRSNTRGQAEYIVRLLTQVTSAEYQIQEKEGEK